MTILKNWKKFESHINFYELHYLVVSFIIKHEYFMMKLR